MSVNRVFSGVGGVIRQARINLGLSLRDLGNRIGMSHGYINDIEHGFKNPSELSLRRLAKALNLNCDDLLLGVGMISFKAKSYLMDHPNALLVLRSMVKLNLTDGELFEVLSKVRDLGDSYSVNCSTKKYPVLHSVIKRRSR